ncbi:hypothetical protein OL599_13450 [Rhodovastum sp. RN2-1]|uniref:Uncharacterized protein n=2 Tax=Limobrevibacterium gyesilva TaxID=2991712 RepID=A0AA41YLE0_9PROT|nr:hypothetical protein [Limobrevibacterium gyesilva]
MTASRTGPQIVAPTGAGFVRSAPEYTITFGPIERTTELPTIVRTARLPEIARTVHLHREASMATKWVFELWTPQGVTAQIYRNFGFTLPLAGDSIASIVSISAVGAVTGAADDLVFAEQAIGPNDAGRAGQIVSAKVSGGSYNTGNQPER